MDCARCEVKGTIVENVVIRSQYERLYVENEEHELNKLGAFSGTIRSLAFKRDAMGFGDVKFIACIGAFLGWQAVLASIMIASLAGSLVGLTSIALRKREWSTKIPFGPYLALGGVVWTFFGAKLLLWWSAYTSLSPE
jgi:leader peptidase (prepilin peptidase)/N-methyltransferase